MNISGYKIEKKLGQGAMATVYLAIQESLGRPVAMKLLLPTHADTPEFSDRFFAEGRIVAAIRHRNVVTIHDLGIADGYHYISMEHLEGGDLMARIAAGMNRGQALDVVRQIAEGLGAAHEAGIVHRDVKPANILFRKDGTAVVTDFGIAKQLEADSDLTLTGTVLGSPGYLSPEQAVSKPVDGRSDIYSLGIILYEMLCGEKPYRGGSPMETVLMHVQQPVPTLSDVFADLQPLLERMLAKRPGDRFADIQALQAYLDTLEPDSPPTSPSQDAEKTLVLPPAAGGRPTMLGSIWARAGRGGLFMLKPTIGLFLVLVIPAVVYWYFEGSNGLHVQGLHSAAPRAAPIERKSHGPTISGDTIAAAPQPAPAVVAAVAVEDKAVPKPAAPIERKSHGPAISGDTIAAAPQPAPAVAAAVAVEDKAVPKPAAPVEPIPDPVALETERYLRLAREAVRKLRLTTPAGNNAYFYLQRVLELAPQDERAAALRVAIADRYADMAQTRIEKFNYEQANRYIDKGLRVQPTNRRLLRLRGQAKVTHLPQQLFQRVKKLF